jgi:periplasmic protein TonB
VVEPPKVEATPPTREAKTAQPPAPKIAAAPPKSEPPAPAPAKSSSAPATSVAEFKVHAGSAPKTVPAPESMKAQITAPSGLDAGTAVGVESVAGAAELSEKPKIAPGTMLPIDQVDTLPVTLSRTLPIYSVQARQMRIQGTVVLNVLINDKGTVDDVVVAQGVPGGDVNEAAVKAAKQWTYRPATKDGVPVKVWKSEFVTFKL